MGKVFKYGDNIDTDVIIPARYLNTTSESELARHCMEDIDKNFAKNVLVGDFIVAEKNFGCGSSREHAPIAIKASGIKCIIATNFARIFYRNAINMGLAILECPKAAQDTKNGDELEINLEKGIIKNVTSNKEYKAKEFPKFMRNVIDKGGLISMLKHQIAQKGDTL